MSGFYKKAVVWLGLNEDYPEAPEVESRRAPRPEPSDRPVSRAEAAPLGEPRRKETVRASNVQAQDSVIVAKPVGGAPSTSTSTVRAIPAESPSSSEPAQPMSIGTVRPVPAANTIKPKVIIPQSFNDAQLVADTFRLLKPVIVNMQNAERDLARRLIDFSSGLCYGLGGQMEKVAKDVYLLTPDEVEVAEEDRDAY